MVDESLHTVELQAWLVQWRNGDREALNQILARVSRRLLSLARQVLRGYPGVERWTESDDVLQNASLRLVRALESVEPRSMRDFYALAALQIRRELVDLSRHHFGPHGQAAHHDSRGGDSRPPPEPSDWSHEPGGLVQWREFHERIETLPEDEREVVGLLYYQGLTQAEAATVLDVNVRTIQRRWHAALLTLQPLLADLKLS